MNKKKSAKSAKPTKPTKSTKSEPKVNTIPINFKDPPLKIPGIRLNIGSGIDYKQGFINIDKYDDSADADWDILNLPLKENSVAQVVAFEVLEHLPHHDSLIALKEWHRVLKSGGTVHLTVPDVVDLCNRVLRKPDDEWGLIKIYGSQTNEGQFHKTCFTPKRLFNLFGMAGFRRVATAYFGDEKIERNIYVEAVK